MSGVNAMAWRSAPAMVSRERDGGGRQHIKPSCFAMPLPAPTLLQLQTRPAHHQRATNNSDHSSVRATTTSAMCSYSTVTIYICGHSFGGKLPANCPKSRQRHRETGRTQVCDNNNAAQSSSRRCNACEAEYQRALAGDKGKKKMR